MSELTKTGQPAVWRGGVVSGQAERVFGFERGLVQFGTTFVKSEAFKALFRDGMMLVEDTAEYLDDIGRTESNRLGRSAALAYASESMRLTTRLMQIASWLLVQRAVAEGEITASQAQREKERVRLVPQDVAVSAVEFEALPERFRELVALSLRFHARVMHLDGLLASAEHPERRLANPVGVQQDLLKMAFGMRASRTVALYPSRG